jgi:hypothetical protein
MSTPTSLPNQVQLELSPPPAAGELPVRAQPHSNGSDARVAEPRTLRRDRVTVDLRGLRSRLDAQAAHHQTTTAALVRRGVLLMLGSIHREGITCTARPLTAKGAKVTLRLTPAHAAMLTKRAREADVSQGQYVCALLDGMPPPPLPPDHAISAAALRESTDRVAAMSADLNAFLRLLGRVPGTQLDAYRAGLTSLAGDMRAHLSKASTLIADLAPSRRPR